MNNLKLSMSLLKRIIKNLNKPSFVFFKFFCTKRIPAWSVPIFARQKAPVPPKAKKNIVPIVLDTYTGISQVVHPDAIYRDGRYVLVITPFPYDVSTYENPCLYTSADGIHFSPAAGLAPLAIRTGGEADYLSDPAIVFYDGFYYVYYREYINTYGTRETIIWKTRSEDLINWHEHAAIYKQKSDILSPSVLPPEDDSGAVIYYVEPGDNMTTFCRCKEKDGRLFDFENLELSGLPEEMILWHIDINAYKNLLVGLMTLSKGTSGEDSKLYMGVSYDGGKSWEITKEIFLFDNQNEFFRQIYKSSLVNVDETEDKYNLYFSAMTKKNAYYTYMVKDFNINENL